VSTLQNAGQFITVAPCVFYDRYGPRPSAFVGAMLSFVGFALMYLASSGILGWSNYIMMGIFAFIMGQGSSMAYKVALVTQTRNFDKEDHGKIIGLLSCCFGISSAIFTQLKDTFFHGNIPQFFLFLAIITSTVTLFFGMFQNVVPIKQSDIRRLVYAYVIVFVLAIYLVVSALLEYFTVLQRDPLYFTAGVVILWIAPVFLGVRSTFLASATNYAVTSDRLDSTEDRGMSDSELHTEFDSVSEELFQFKSNDKTLGQAMRTAKYWVIFVVNTCLIGSGIVILNNLAAIVISKMEIAGNVEFPVTETPIDLLATFVTIFAVSDSFGRAIFTLVSDYFVARFPRAIFLLFVTAVLGLTHLYVAVSNITMLYAAMVSLGLSFGGIWALLPALLADYFGTRHLSAIDSSMGFASTIGVVSLSHLLAGGLSDRFGAERHICIKDEGECVNYCHGSDCYFYTLLTNLGLCVICLVLVFFLIQSGQVREKYSDSDTLEIEKEDFLEKDIYED